MSNDLRISDYVSKIFKNVGYSYIASCNESSYSTIFEIRCHSFILGSSELRGVIESLTGIGCNIEDDKYLNELRIGVNIIEVATPDCEITLEIPNENSVRNALALLALGRM